MLLALILFPFGWLGDVWPPFGAVLGVVFATAQLHAVGHALLFFTLGLLALYIFPLLAAHPLRYAGVMLLASLGQEAFQLLYKQRPLEFDDYRDVVVDAVAWTLAFTLVWAWRRARNTHSAQ